MDARTAITEIASHESKGCDLVIMIFSEPGSEEIHIVGDPRFDWLKCIKQIAENHKWEQ